MPPKMFWTMAMISVAWALLVAGASVVYRRRRGKYILRPQFPDAIYTDRWRSGRSLRNGLTRHGGANGCLWVAVTPDTLHVGLHFPFNLAFLPELYGLEYRVATTDVVGVEHRRSFFGRRSVAVRFRAADGEQQTLELQVSDPDRFVAALAAAADRP